MVTPYFYNKNKKNKQKNTKNKKKNVFIYNVIFYESSKLVFPLLIAVKSFSFPFKCLIGWMPFYNIRIC